MKNKEKLLAVMLLSLLILGGGGYLYFKLITAEQETFVWQDSASDVYLAKNELIPSSTSTGKSNTSAKSIKNASNNNQSADFRNDVLTPISQSPLAISRTTQRSIASGGSMPQSTNYGMQGMQHEERSISQSGAGNSSLAYAGSANRKTTGNVNQYEQAEFGSYNFGGNTSINPPVLFAPNGGGAGNYFGDPGGDPDPDQFIPVGKPLFPLLILSFIYAFIIIRRRK